MRPFKSILHALIKEPTEVQEQYFSRLKRVVDSASDIGWGYYDYISDLLEEYFPDKSTWQQFQHGKRRGGFSNSLPRSTLRGFTKLTAKDAIHVACAVEIEADYFITCDDRLMRQAKKLDLALVLMNPVDFIRQEKR